MKKSFSLNKKIISLLMIAVVLLGVFFLFSSKTTDWVNKLISIRQSKKSVTAGGVPGFQKYTIEIPASWEVEQKTDEGENGESELNSLTLSKFNYKIVIHQEQIDVSECIYSEIEQIGGPDLIYQLDNYKELIAKDGTTWRRSWNEKDQDNSEGRFVICTKYDQRKQFSNYTPFGFISYSTPNEDYSEKTLEEMDSIVSSIRGYKEYVQENSYSVLYPVDWKVESRGGGGTLFSYFKNKDNKVVAVIAESSGSLVDEETYKVSDDDIRLDNLDLVRYENKKTGEEVYEYKTNNYGILWFFKLNGKDSEAENFWNSVDIQE